MSSTVLMKWLCPRMTLPPSGISSGTSFSSMPQLLHTLPPLRRGSPPKRPNARSAPRPPAPGPRVVPLTMDRRSFLAAPAALCALRDAEAAPADPSRQFQLGCVTYNVLKDMDLDTIIRTLEGAGFAAVELRTEHKHGVEPSISAAERIKVRDRFAASKIKLVSYGTTCEFQSTDEAARRKQIETAHAFIDLAKD